MTEETHKKPATTGRIPSVVSAPELPDHVAEQFGLTRRDEGSPQNGALAKLEDAPFDDPKTDAAVDDILHKESDALLDASGTGSIPTVTPVPARGGLHRFFRAWWRNKWAHGSTIVLLLAVLVMIGAVQPLRYALLNTAGVRSSASVVVLDDTTKLPLKNVTVTLGSKKALTDIEGRAQFSDLRMGEYHLAIGRLAFASRTQTVTIGWGSNPLGAFRLKATGLQYVLSISDYLSGRPVEGAEVTQDGFNALSDKSGKVVLTVEDADVATLSVSIKAEGYRTETRQLDPVHSEGSKVVLVPSQKHVFISKQSGTYDVFSIDLDGANQKLLLAGTGSETSNHLSLAVSPDGQYAAYVSTRDNMRDAEGYLLPALTIINLGAGTSMTVDHAAQIQLVDWIGSRLVYRATIAGASAANSQRNRLIGLNYETNSRAQLAAANQFNTVLSARGFIYYGASSTDPDATLGLFRVKPDGSARKQLSNDEVWTGLRPSYYTISLQSSEGWQVYSLKDEKFTRTDSPETLAPFVFTDSPSGKYSAWTDIRDGKGTLLLYDITRETHRNLVSQDGLAGPLRWLSDSTLIYRVATAGETADYAVSTLGGSVRKIADITSSQSYIQAY